MREFVLSPQRSYASIISHSKLGAWMVESWKYPRIFKDDKLLLYKEHTEWIRLLKYQINRTHLLHLNVVSIFGLHVVARLVSREGIVEGTFRGGFVPRESRISHSRVPKLPGSSGSHIISDGAGILWSSCSFYIKWESDIRSRREVGRKRKRETEEEKRSCSGTVRNVSREREREREKERQPKE